MSETNPAHAQLTLLLIQIRESEEIAEHERRSLLDVTGLPEHSLWSWNIAKEGVPDSERVKAADGVLIGGAGVYSATHDDPFIPGLVELIRRLADDQRPLFGSCYGHQIIGRALGGEVITDEAHAEVGCHSVTLTDHAREDDVFGPLWLEGHRTFPVLMGHHDRVSELPPGAVEIAHSEVCGNQAFRVEGTPVWGTQFHSELTPERLIERLERYADIYAPGDNTLDRLRAQVRPTPEARTLLNRFLDVVTLARR